MNTSDLDIIEEYWRIRSRKDFYSYRQYINANKIKLGWFTEDLAANLQQFYNDMVAGLRPILIIVAPPQHGKEIDDNTPVLTPDGFKNHGDLLIGDYVFHPSGTPVRVIDVIPQPEPCDYLVTMSNGEQIKCHRNHEWTVTTHSWRGRFKTLETKELLKSDLWIGKKGNRGSRVRYQLPFTECVKFNHRPLELDPYFIGMWLGDGCKTSTGVHLAFGENESIEYLSTMIPISNIGVHKKTKVRKFYFGDNGKTIESLHTLNLFNNKHIPDQYLFSSKPQRLDLLAGLIDSDGSLYKKTGQYRFVNINKRLIDQVTILLSSLGYSYSVTKTQPREKPNSYGIQDKSVCYQIGFTPHDIIPCKIPRKQSTKKPISRRVSIVDITPCEPVRGKCISVDSPDGLYLAGKMLVPTHNSFSITDFITWYLGKRPTDRIIYASFSDRLGIRANRTIQRTIDKPKHKSIFPDLKIGGLNNVTHIGKLLRNNDIVETDQEGCFRNTTVGGPINGEGLDLGIIDDALKGRKEANSKTIRESVWGWLTDDFMSRFSEYAGLLMINTRWHIDDPAGRLMDKLDLVENGGRVKLCHYSALDKNEKPLFPEHKSKTFLLERKEAMLPANWQSVYQGSPTVVGGNIVKSDWWRWGDVRPKIKHRFITADTAQKKNTWNDYTVFQAWGVCYAGNIHLLDQVRERMTAPELRKNGKEFYDRHNGILHEPLRGMYIEDKSSGVGLIQELELEQCKVEAVPRNTDKVERAMNCGPEIKSGKVYLYKDVIDVDIIVDEASACPNGLNDDAFDCTMTAIEVEFLNKQVIDYSGLL